jgi:hypothetical protein
MVSLTYLYTINVMQWRGSHFFAGSLWRENDISARFLLKKNSKADTREGIFKLFTGSELSGGSDEPCKTV